MGVDVDIKAIHEKVKLESTFLQSLRNEVGKVIVGQEYVIDLGNACFKEGRLGYTILYYEKARRIQPNDSELYHNLELDRSQIVDEVTGPPGDFLTASFNRVVTLLPIDLMTQLALIFFLVGSSSLTLFLLWNSLRGRQLCLILSALFLLLFLLAGVLNTVQIDRQISSQEAIVLSPEVAVMSGPGDENSALFEVHEGLTISLSVFFAWCSFVSLRAPSWITSQTASILFDIQWQASYRPCHSEVSSRPFSGGVCPGLASALVGTGRRGL